MNLIVELVSFGIAVFGAIAGVWWKVDAKIRTAEERAIGVENSLSAHRLHVAETYLTKAGLREQIEPLFDAVKGVSGQVQTMNERPDRVIEGRAVPARRS